MPHAGGGIAPGASLRLWILRPGQPFQKSAKRNWDFALGAFGLKCAAVALQPDGHGLHIAGIRQFAHKSFSAFSYCG